LQAKNKAQKQKTIANSGFLTKRPALEKAGETLFLGTKIERALQNIKFWESLNNKFIFILKKNKELIEPVPKLQILEQQSWKAQFSKVLALETARICQNR
jgi:hypothetical protein